ncbi:MAG: biotin carboxylase N-terminal domain-containing protein, partial [Ktedonobacterales bacterium]
MFKKVLIANRGEIALRVIRACREMGVTAVIAYSEADRDSLPVRMADERICIGPGPGSKSYLHIPNIISAALLTGCEAIHPGYGFLSENASFAEICVDVGVVFIGPPPAAMVQMGDKVQARIAMEREGLPMLPGTDVLHTVGEGEAAAERIGFPRMIMGGGGGGGRGFRMVRGTEVFTLVFTKALCVVRVEFHV